jgi:hypothetical protein
MLNNAVLIQTPTNYLKLWAFDNGLGTLELYKRNPLLYPDLPIVVVKNNKATFWYTSNKPNVVNYKLKLLNDAITESGLTQFKKGLIITQFKASQSE